MIHASSEILVFPSKPEEGKPPLRTAFFLRHPRINSTEGRLYLLQDTPPPSPDRPISNPQFLTNDLLMRAVITGEVTPPEQGNKLPFFVGQLPECSLHQLTIPVQPAQQGITVKAFEVSLLLRHVFPSLDLRPGGEPARKGSPPEFPLHLQLYLAPCRIQSEASLRTSQKRILYERHPPRVTRCQWITRTLFQGPLSMPRLCLTTAQVVPGF